MARVLAIPDIHAPFEHPDTLSFLKKVYKQYKCDTVVCLGDELDFHAVSRWPKDPDGLSAGDEFIHGLAFMQKLFKLFPEAKCCISNHTVRPFKVGFDAGLPKIFFREYGEFMNAPSTWSWHDEIEIDGVLYIHGHGFSGKYAHLKACEAYRQSVVIGHIHSFGGVQYNSGRRNTIFGMNAGCLIDASKYAFAYSKTLPYKPTLGCGVIIDGEHALFIPMESITL